MMPFKVGVLSDSFRLTPREGVRKAKEVGADGVQVNAVTGEIRHDLMDHSTRRDFKTFCNGLGLGIAALCGDLGGHGFQRPGDNPAKIEDSKRIVDMAAELGTYVVTCLLYTSPSPRD